MAARYWVGGTASWDATAGTKWALTDGGAGGQAVPTSADDVFFTAASGASTVTIATGNTGAKSINCTGFTGTLAGTAAISVAGSITLASGMGVSYSGSVTVTGTGTITSNGKSFNGNVIINGTSITVTLGSAFTTAQTLTVTRGTFTTNNYAITATSFASTGSLTRAIILGSSAVALSSSLTPLNFSITGLTFSPGTSVISCTGSSLTFEGGGGTFATVNFTSTASTTTRTITGANTFASLGFNGKAADGICSVLFSANQTVTGTFTIAPGARASARTFYRSDVLGTPRTITAGTFASGSAHADFRDIVAGGATFNGTGFGNCKGNTGISFPPAKTVYWNGENSYPSWIGLSPVVYSWATSSNGSTSAANFPLAQDTAVFTNNAPNSGTTVAIPASFNIGTIDMSARTNAMPLGIGTNSPVIYGDFLTGTGVTLTGTTGTLVFAGRQTQTVDLQVGITFPYSIELNSPGGSLLFAKSVTLGSTRSFFLTAGTLGLQSNDLVTGFFATTTTPVKSIDFGNGAIRCIGTGTVFNMGSVTNFTSTGSRRIDIAATGSSVTVTTGALTSTQALNFNFVSGTYSLTFLGVANSTAGSVDFTGFSGTWATTSTSRLHGSLTLSPTMTVGASTSTLTFWPIAEQEVLLTTNGKTIDRPIAIAGETNSKVILVGAFTIGSSRTLSLTSGTLQTDNYNVTAGYVFVSGSTARHLKLGTSTLTITGSGGNPFNATTATNLTVSGTGVISITGPAAKNFIGGGIQTYPTLNQGSSGGTLTVTGSNKFLNITNTTNVEIQFTGGTTQEFVNFSLNGVDTANRLKVGSTNGTPVIFKKSTPWDVGAGSIANFSGGFNFTGTSPNYLEFNYIVAQVVVASGNSRFFAFF